MHSPASCSPSRASGCSLQFCSPSSQQIISLGNVRKLEGQRNGFAERAGCAEPGPGLWSLQTLVHPAAWVTSAIPGMFKDSWAFPECYSVSCSMAWHKPALRRPFLLKGHRAGFSKEDTKSWTQWELGMQTPPFGAVASQLTPSSRLQQKRQMERAGSRNSP